MASPSDRPKPCQIMPRQSGTTPLHMAAFGNNVQLVLDNLMMGADVNSVNKVIELLCLPIMMYHSFSGFISKMNTHFDNSI